MAIRKGKGLRMEMGMSLGMGIKMGLNIEFSMELVCISWNGVCLRLRD